MARDSCTPFYINQVISTLNLKRLGYRYEVMAVAGTVKGIHEIGFMRKQLSGLPQITPCFSAPKEDMKKPIQQTDGILSHISRSMAVLGGREEQKAVR